jgi:phytoene synthase
MRVLKHLGESLTLPLQGAGRLPSAPDASLTGAYRACTEIMRRKSKSFYFSARLLPPAKRPGILALYAFCRTSDDLVDAGDAAGGSGGGQEGAREKARRSLNGWAAQVTSETAYAGNRQGLTEQAKVGCDNADIARAWADTRKRYAIPAELAEELLAGVRMDLSIDRYGSWDELWLYCYRVASTVGLMSMYIMGAQSMKAVPYAVQLGVALQLTNILRDVGEDARAGRIYLPREDMERFGYTEEMLMSGVVNREFVALMDFEIGRAKALYRSALPGIGLLPPDSRLAVSAAAIVYRGILGKIVAGRYDVFNRRAHLTTGEKLRALPAIWWRAKRTGWAAKSQ